MLGYSAKNVGYNEAHTGNMSISSLEYDERPACRQSAEPRDGVCNGFGQTHEVNNRRC